MIDLLRKILKSFGQKEESMSAADEVEGLYGSLNDDILQLVLGADLIALGKNFAEKISEIRKEIKSECGFILPPVRILDNKFIQENEFDIFINGKKIETGFLVPNYAGINEEFYETMKTVIYDNLQYLFTTKVAEKYIDSVQSYNSWLVYNLFLKISIIDLKTIMLDIINQGKSINNVNYILEQIGEHVLGDGKLQDCYTRHNPHLIAKYVAKRL